MENASQLVAMQCAHRKIAPNSDEDLKPAAINFRREDMELSVQICRMTLISLPLPVSNKKNPEPKFSYADSRIREGILMKPALSGRRLVIAVALILTAQFGMAQTTLSKAEVEKRVVSILSQMTLEEKINIIGGVNDFYTRPDG